MGKNLIPTFPQRRISFISKIIEQNSCAEIVVLPIKKITYKTFFQDIYPLFFYFLGPTYLIFGNKADKEQWLYHLTVVSGGDPKAGTQFEQLIQKLMEDDGSARSAVWRHPVMTYSKDPITTPLTTFTSDEMQNEALKLFKVSFFFM